MSVIWECENCKAQWWVHLFSCPRCKNGATVAKSTVNNGASDATLPENPPAPPVAEPVVDEVEPEPEFEETPTPTREDWTEHYEAKTKAELVDELYGLDLPTSGNKPELVERLVAWQFRTEAHAGVAEAKGTAHE